MKKSKTFRLLGMVMLGFLLISCGVQKRQYMSGYYHSWKKSSAEPKLNHSKHEKPETSVADNRAAENVTDEKDGELMASADKGFALPSKKAGKPLIEEPAAKKHNEDPAVKKAQAEDQKVSRSMVLPYKKFRATPQLKPLPLKSKVKEGFAYNGFAIASLACGVLALIPYYSAFLFGVLAIVFGAIALKRIRQNPEYKGRGMAIAGLVCGIVAIAIILLALAVVATFAALVL